MSGTAAPGQRKRKLWRSAAWLALGLVLGLQALRMRVAEAAVDRRDAGQAVAFRPQNGAGRALLAERRLAAGDPRGALVASRAALERSALSVIAVRTYAQALDAVNGPGSGEQAWQVAGAMGWRDPHTQLWAMSRALSSGNAPVFAMRVDAILRLRSDDPQMASLIRQAMLEPEIRAQFAQRVALDPEWRATLFALPPRAPSRELDGAVALLEALGTSSRPPRREELRDTLAGLIVAGRYGEAMALDRRFVRRAVDAGSLIDDGGFERRDSDYRTSVTPFDWTIVRGATVDQSAGRRSILMISDGRRRPLVQRHVALAPGRYRLSYRMMGRPEASAIIGFRVHCVAGEAELGSSARVPLAGNGWEQRAFDFTVPADCPLVRTEWTVLQSGPAEAQVDDVAIARVP